MAKKRSKKPVLLERRELGLRILPTGVSLLYQLVWSDGSVTYDRGRTVHGRTPFELKKKRRGSLEERIYRDELGLLLLASKEIIETFESACRHADSWIAPPEPPKKKKKRKKPKPEPINKPMKPKVVLRTVEV